MVAEDVPAPVNYSQAKSSALTFSDLQSEKLRISLAKTPSIDLSKAGY